MKILVLLHAYPNKDSLYANRFVHERLTGYNKICKNDIFSLVIKQTNNTELPKDYEYEGIQVKHILLQSVLQFINDFKPDIILIHFYNYKYFEIVKNIEVPIIIWVHGFEAISWKRRLYKLNKPISFFKYAVKVQKQLSGYKKFIKFANTKKNIYFVFVSEWMKNIAFSDIGIKSENYKIIPNYINTDFFFFKEKIPDSRKNILLIKNFDSKKYAVDIAVKSILYLERKFSHFNDFRFTIVGQGILWNKYTERLSKFSNIRLINSFLSHYEIKKLHDENGIFLSPTRQDSQGVSMCEAMSSGLVPVTSMNTAIPEFVNKQCGYLTHNYREIANALIDMYINPNKFLRKSFNAANYIRNKANFTLTIQEEFNLMKKLVEEMKNR